MSTPSSPVVATAAAAPAPKLNSIQLIEQEIVGFFKQKEQAIANLHALDGAIQAAQHLVAVLKTAAAKAEAEAVKIAGEVKTDAEKVATEVKTEATKIVDAVVVDAKKL